MLNFDNCPLNIVEKIVEKVVYKDRPVPQPYEVPKYVEKVQYRDVQVPQVSINSLNLFNAQKNIQQAHGRFRHNLLS